MTVSGAMGRSLTFSPKSVTYKGHEFLLAELNILKVRNTRRGGLGLGMYSERTREVG